MLGGPYCGSIDYRREILGNLHNWSLCHICLSAMEDRKSIPYNRLGMCDKRVDQYTVGR